MALFSVFSRPDIGLRSDSSSNLAEIFDSDKRAALRNTLISPETLDSIYRLSSSIDREDLRAASGLSRLLLPSLNQLNEIVNDRVPTQLFISPQYYNPRNPLGGAGSPGQYSDNVVIFNGGIKCSGAQYKANTIGSTFFSNPVVQTINLSTSRASLFNAEADTENTGYIKSARFPGSIRVRRRSHVNRVILPKTSFLAKAPVLENPSHSISVNIDNNNTGTASPVRLLATKNTPLRIYCRLSTGKIRFTFIDNNRPYFFGYQVQPAQQRPNFPEVDFLEVEPQSQVVGSNVFELNIDITKTGYQNLYDLYLYVYVNPEKVSGIDFEGIDIRESPDRRDLGLIGFDNLESLRISGGSMTILPLWLKTLKNKLKVLNIAASGDSWRAGPMGYFDYRDTSATPTASIPLYTGVSYMTMPIKGTIVTGDPLAWNGEFEQYVKGGARTYRQFSLLEELRLGGRFLGKNPSLHEEFPNLTVLSWANDRRATIISGTPPKINNNNKLIEYNITATGASGSITSIGTNTSDPNNNGHISKYQFNSFLVSGSEFISHSGLTGYIANPSENWSSWTNNTTGISIAYTSVTINLQANQWRQLVKLEASDSGGAVFDGSSNPLNAPKLSELSLYDSGTTGPMPTLGSENNTNALTSINIGACDGITAVTEDGVNYLLPSNFATDRDHKLQSFSASDLNLSCRLRYNRDFQYLKNLSSLSFSRSNLTGRFPVLPVEEGSAKVISVNADAAKFYDLRSLTIRLRNLGTIDFRNQNSGSGGCLIPSFLGESQSTISSVDLRNCLPTKYPSDWSVVGLRGKKISASDPETTINDPLTLTVLTSSADPDDSVYEITGLSNFSQKVLVNDLVGDFGIVSSVSNSKITFIPTLANVPTSLPSPLIFKRRTNDISSWYQRGFSSLTFFNASNCRLSGNLDIRSGFDKLSELNLSDNSINDYQVGGFSNRVFKGNSRAVTINLSNNNISPVKIREIVQEISTIADSSRFRGSIIIIRSEENYKQEDIFPTTIEQLPDVVNSVFRNESFYPYTEKTTTNESGNTVTEYVQGSPIVRQVPGQLSGSIYYTRTIQKVQKITENSVGSLFSRLTNIRFDLGFSYSPPTTSPTVLSTTYDPSSSISRNSSITSSGLTALSSCPNGVGTGSCWENSSGQVLKLIG